MGFFSKKKDDYLFLVAVCDGQLKNIKDVQDPVFSEKMMGDGFAIVPLNNHIFSPVKGKVISIFPTMHAVNLETESGIQVIVHMGLDTVELNGEGFTVFVDEGDKVEAGQAIADMDCDIVSQKGKHTDVVVIFPNLEGDQQLDIYEEGKVNQSQEIGKIKL